MRNRCPWRAGSWWTNGARGKKERRLTVCAPAAAAWPQDILRQLYNYRMADQIISTCISLEKAVDPLWVAITVRIEDLLPHTAMNVDLARCQHGNAATSAQQKALLVVEGQLFGAQQHRRGLPCRQELNRWVAICACS